MAKFKHPDLTETEKDLLHKLNIARYIIGRVRSCDETFDQYRAQIKGINETINKYEYGD